MKIYSLAILLIEDEEAHAQLIERALSRTSLSTSLTHVSTGSEALAVLAEQKFDLVLLDYSLPGENDLELLIRIVEAGCPVIMITAKGNEVVAVEAMKRGAIDYLVKSPETFDLLPTIVERTAATLETRRTLVETEALYRQLINSSTDAIISTNRDGIIVVFNPGAEELLGYRREEVVGQVVTILYESEERAKEVMRRMHEGGGRVAGFETILRAKDGSHIPVLISASILYDEEGEESGTVGFNKDLRERKRAKEQLIRSDKLAALGKLTAGVSHEILNPLNIITMSLQLMTSDPETPPEIVRQLRVLDEQAQRINRITQELLYFARQREPERRWIDVNQTLRRTLSLFEKELRLQNVAVELKLSEELEDVLADQDQLLQVVLNLLTNARDAMPGGGRLILSTEVVEADGQRFVEVRVEDTGPGIPPEHMEKLFDPFFTTKGEGEGTGIGLSICHGIVEAHGGSIRVESELGRGTTFIIQLPL